MTHGRGDESLSAVGIEIPNCEFSEDDFRRFAARLQENLATLGGLLRDPDFGAGAVTIGAETELHLIDDEARPAGVNRAVLAGCSDPTVTLEVDSFNVEINARPHRIEGAPFSAMERELKAAVAEIERAAAPLGVRPAMIGILPTLQERDLQSTALTDNNRYRALSAGIRRVKQSDFTVRIDGRESLSVHCSDVTLEGANTSFQVHLRCRAGDFAASYNAAQLATAIALAVSGNSPFFLGRSLWEETRIALFRQAVDDRDHVADEDWRPSRVSFGHGWVRRGAYELFAEAVRLHEPLIPVLGDEQEIAGRPSLAELRLHQGTVWRWNRAIYDPADGGHLRIEFRALPSGPTVLDMIANAAFLIGLTLALREGIESKLEAISFGHARRNFYQAARYGLKAELLWPTEKGHSPVLWNAAELARLLLPEARRGLTEGGVEQNEIDRLMAIIGARIESGQTGAGWQQKALASDDDRFASMLNRYVAFSKGGAPVHSWSLS